MKGVGEYFDYIDYLLLEINTKELYAESPLLKDIDKYLFNLGYQRVVTVYWDKTVTGEMFLHKKELIKKPLILKIKLRIIFLSQLFTIFLKLDPHLTIQLRIGLFLVKILYGIINYPFCNSSYLQ